MRQLVPSTLVLPESRGPIPASTLCTNRNLLTSTNWLLIISRIYQLMPVMACSVDPITPLKLFVLGQISVRSTPSVTALIIATSPSLDSHIAFATRQVAPYHHLSFYF